MRSESRIPRVLLITATPPGNGNVGEIILRDLCSYYPTGQVSCLAVTSRGYVSQPEARLSGLPLKQIEEPFGSFISRMPGRLGSLHAHWKYWRTFKPAAQAAIQEAVRFGQEQAVQMVWMILNSPMTISMGSAVARQLGVPLVSLVWDPPEYLLRQAWADRLTRQQIMQSFAQTLQQSQRVAVVSETMQHDYERQYGARCVILRHGLKNDQLRPPTSGLASKDKLLIGFAGSLYADSAWEGLWQALQQARWQIGDRQVTLRLLGSAFQFRARSPMRVEFLGFRSTEETADLLAECDLLYLPQPFEKGWEEFARYSFPTKLSTYLATGKPTFIHAPESASLPRFFENHPIGACCTSLNPEQVLQTLEALLLDPSRYAAASQASIHIAQQEFNMRVFHDRFAQFLGISPEALQPI